MNILAIEIDLQNKDLNVSKRDTECSNSILHVLNKNLLGELGEGIFFLPYYYYYCACILATLFNYICFSFNFNTIYSLKFLILVILEFKKINITF